jgi:flagellar basal body L-ring protein FlgH
MGAWRGRRLFAVPRATAAALTCVLGAVALLGSGCGAEETVNDPRPQPPTRVSVAIGDGATTVQPPRIAIGPEPTQQIPQNQHARQPPVRSNAPLNVVLVAANLTDVDSRLEVSGNGKDLSSEPLYANATVTLQAILPTGVYRVSAAGTGSKPAKLVVGPYRTSSKNDLLLP